MDPLHKLIQAMRLGFEAAETLADDPLAAVEEPHLLGISDPLEITAFSLGFSVGIDALLTTSEASNE